MVSIIIPVYNVRDYVVKCLESVAAQTFKGSLECLIVDDCGQDDSIELAEEFVRGYNGDIDFRIIHHEQNKGLSAARNTGIREAVGDWIYFLDSDDWIIPKCIELMWQCVEKHPDTQVVFAGAETTSPKYAWMDITTKNLSEYCNNRKKVHHSIIKRIDYCMTAWNRLISKSLIISNLIFFQDGAINEDEMWNFLLSKYVNTVSVCKHNTYVYVVRNDSIVADSKKICNNWKNVINYYIQNVGGQYSWEETIFVYDMIQNIKSLSFISIKDERKFLWKMLLRSGKKQKIGILGFLLLPRRILQKDRVYSVLRSFVGYF